MKKIEKLQKEYDRLIALEKYDAAFLVRIKINKILKEEKK